MKPFCLAILLSIMVVASFGQQHPPYGTLLFTDTLKFSPLDSRIKISESNKTWEIGIPSKAGMNDSYDGFPVIATKLTENYPLGSNDYFDVELPYYDQMWGEGILSFWHKYDTDSLKDGGIIEGSFDGGETWKNLTIANVTISNFYSGLYTTNDTIVGNIPAFTGRSMDWKRVELYWFWLALTKRSNAVHGMILRFKFHSRETSTPKGGWEISNMMLKAYHITGSVADNSSNEITLFPNPTKGNMNLSMIGTPNNHIFSLYSQTGTKLFDLTLTSQTQNINLCQCSIGTYTYIIRQNNKIIKAGQIVKE